MTQLLQRRITLVALAMGSILAGCGTNKFQQELQVEEAAIKLAEETIKGEYELISTADLKKLMDDKQELILVDAMPAAESYNKGHLAGAVNFEFPKEVIDQWTKDAMGDRTKADYEKLLGDRKETTIVVYCGSSNVLEATTRQSTPANWATPTSSAIPVAFTLGAERVMR